MLNGQWTDFISDFLAYTEGPWSSRIHRLWCGISCLGGALERRVWAPLGNNRKCYANFYTLLVAPPGGGKQVINVVKELWRDTIDPATNRPIFSVGADSVSRASIIDDLAKSKCTRMTPDGLFTYHSLLVAVEEFEVILHTYDPSFISILNSIWNNPSDHRETRRHGPAREVTIPNPTFNIIGGVTPAYFVAHFPDEAWNTGLIRRVLMIYSSEALDGDIFEDLPEQEPIREVLLHRLAQAAQLFGPAIWTPEAVAVIREWRENSYSPKPTHSRLSHYLSSRTQFIVKLALVSAVSRTGTLTILDVDVRRAQEWLFEAESFMPDIFRAMIGKSDSQIIEELHFYMQTTWIKNKQTPFSTASIKKFLGQRLPSEKVDPVLKLAEGMDVIARRAGADDLWIPRPKHLHAPE